MARYLASRDRDLGSSPAVHKGRPEVLRRNEAILRQLTRILRQKFGSSEQGLRSRTRVPEGLRQVQECLRQVLGNREREPWCRGADSGTVSLQPFLVVRCLKE